MLKQKILPFFIWCLTGIVVAAIFLQNPDINPPSSSVDPKPSTVTFSDSNITDLFGESPATTPTPGKKSNFNLIGIIYSNQPSASRVILQNGSEAPKKYALNDPTPDNGVISKISPKSFDYSLNGKINSISMPKEVSTPNI